MITMIPRSRLEPHPDNPRKDLGDLTELAASIKRSGLLQNLTVVPHPDKPGMYRIIIGHRRFAASAIAGGIDELPCIIENMSPADQVATMLAENMQRNDLSIADQDGQGWNPFGIPSRPRRADRLVRFCESNKAPGVQMMLDLGESVRAIADRTGLSETSIRKRATIATLPKEEMVQAADKGATLLDLLEVTTLTDPESQAQVLNSFGTNNFQWAVRQAREAEQKKKFYAEIMPQIHAKFPKISDLPESERYPAGGCEPLGFASRPYKGDRLDQIENLSEPPREAIWCASVCDEERKPIPDPETGEKYRINKSDALGITLYRENKEWAKRKAGEKDFNEWLKERKARAKALNQEAWELRCAFVRTFRLRTKAQYTEFYEHCMSEVLNWKALQMGLSYYHGGWDSLVIRHMLAIPYENERDKEETFPHELERRGVHRASFLLAWALCGGIAGSVRDDDGWCNTYNGHWKSCEDLDTQYRLLSSTVPRSIHRIERRQSGLRPDRQAPCGAAAFGYEMSDFERSLQDGSHEFFKEEAPR